MVKALKNFLVILMTKNITIIISSADHPINPWVQSWVDKKAAEQNVKIAREVDEATGGSICFLLACSDIIPTHIIDRYDHVLVVHASDVPEGRGWSPHIWNIIEGKEDIVVSLIEASKQVDSGDVWKKYHYQIPRHFLYEEIIAIVNQAHLDLMDFALENHKTVQPVPQDRNVTPTYFPKRSPRDSEIFADKSIEEQFDILRVSDEIRFPAFFRLRGKRFKITIEKYDE